MQPVMKRNAEKLCCFWFINFCYCYSCCLSLFLFCFACLISLIFFYFVLVLFSTIFLIWTYYYPREKLQTYSEASIFFPPYIGQSVRTTAEPGRFSRSLTFPDDLKGLNRVPRLPWHIITSLRYEWLGKVQKLFTLPLCFYSQISKLHHPHQHQVSTRCSISIFPISVLEQILNECVQNYGRFHRFLSILFFTTKIFITGICLSLNLTLVCLKAALVELHMN